MKRICILFAMVLCVSTTAMAQSVAGKVVFEGFGTIGVSVPDGKLQWSTSELDIDMSYSFGATAGYGIMDSLLVFGGFEYAIKPLKFTDDFVDSWFVYKYNSFDILAGARYFISGFYGDLGLFYGFPTGDVKFEAEDGTSSTVESDEINNDYGFLIGAGYLIQVNEQVSVDLGLRAKFGLSKIIDSSSDHYIYSRTYDLKIGATYSL